MSNLEEEIRRLEQAVKSIESRNKKVEMDKAWETSVFRKLSIALLTYAIVVSFFLVIKADNPFINALVPTCGYLLSTLSMGLIKSIWVKQSFYVKTSKDK